MKIVLALALLLNCALANASLLTYQFSGVFNTPTRTSFTGAPSAEPVFLSLLRAGEVFSGSLTFDNRADPLYAVPEGSSMTSYPALAFHLQAGAALDAAAPIWDFANLDVTHYDADASQWLADEVVLHSSVILDADHSLAVRLRMSANEAQAFKNGHVPDGFDGFSDASLGLYLYHNDAPMFDYVDAAVQVRLDNAGTAIPEPATALLMLAGVAGLALQRRRA